MLNLKMKTMNTPKNNEKQLRQSLSAIKRGPVKGLKNVLAYPQEFTWPILKEEKKIKGLEKILEELLPQKTKHLRETSWSQLRRISKEERKILKNKNSDVKTKTNEDKNSIVFGINSVTKGLEKNITCSILLDSSVDPLFMIKHIVITAQSKHIPVIIIPSLKSLTLKKVGFASSALALNKSIIESQVSHFQKLYEKISELAAEFTKTPDALEIFDNKYSESLTFSEKSIADIDIPYILSSSIYKYRTSRKERVFVPLNSKQQIPDNTSLIKSGKTSEEYISLNSRNDMINRDDTVERIVKKRRYIDSFEDEEKREQRKEQKNNRREDSIDHDVNNTKSSIVKNVQSKPKNVPPKKLKKMKNIQNIYLPLKVKQIRKNPNRLKAAKAPK